MKALSCTPRMIAHVKMEHLLHYSCCFLEIVLQKNMYLRTGKMRAQFTEDSEVACFFLLYLCVMVRIKKVL